MRFMTIEAKVRLKNFEHIVDLIEQDGGEVRIANYEGNGKSKSKPKRKKRARITDADRKSIRQFAAKNKRVTQKEISKRFGVSESAVCGILKGVKRG